MRARRGLDEPLAVGGDAEGKPVCSGKIGACAGEGGL